MREAADAPNSPHPISPTALGSEMRKGDYHKAKYEHEEECGDYAPYRWRVQIITGLVETSIGNSSVSECAGIGAFVHVRLPVRALFMHPQ
jgi:hypothetical protein